MKADFEKQIQDIFGTTDIEKHAPDFREAAA